MFPSLRISHFLHLLSQYPIRRLLLVNNILLPPEIFRLDARVLLTMIHARLRRCRIKTSSYSPCIPPQMRRLQSNVQYCPILQAGAVHRMKHYLTPGVIPAMSVLFPSISMGGKSWFQQIWKLRCECCDFPNRLAFFGSMPCASTKKMTRRKVARFH